MAAEGAPRATGDAFRPGAFADGLLDALQLIQVVAHVDHVKAPPLVGA